MRLLAALSLATAALAQIAPPAAPKLENLGRPMAVSALCSVEAVQNAGMVCSAENPCPLYLELSDVEPVGNRVLVTGNLHTSSHTLESLLLASDDAGKTWTEPFARQLYSALDHIQFFDFEVGWITGHVVEKLPKDAFFLLTSDGGRTWRKRPIYGESRAGAMEQFWFDSRTHGQMLFDKGLGGENGMRHELYETSTGGENWSIRQVDTKPIPLKRPPTPDPSWRIRADSKSKAYVLERKQENRWAMVASFLIAAGECKPVEPVVPEEAPTPEVSPEPAATDTFKVPSTQPPSTKRKKK